MGEILTSYGGLAYHPAHTRSLTKAILLVKRSACLLNFAISLEYQRVKHDAYCLLLNSIIFLFSEFQLQ